MTSEEPDASFSPADRSGIGDDGAEVRFEDSYRRLVEYVGGAEDPADPADVLAMQMVLRIEKSDPPERTELLTAAARAVALLCLDDRACGDGPFAAGRSFEVLTIATGFSILNVCGGIKYST
ncbi:hypothetical protein ACWDNR_24300, partial [Gordonia aichiensis]